MTLDDIKDEDLRKYVDMLIPRLMRYKPYEWVVISSIADDVNIFIEIVRCLNEYNLFNNHLGFGILTIKDNSFIRVDPMTILNPHKIAYQWNNKLPTL